MKSGVVIFGFNNDLVDYRAMAEWSAKRIEKFLGLPTTLITDTPFDSGVFDQVIVVESEKGNSKFYHEFASSADWFNTNRWSAFDLSPYDKTLVLDADYVINSDVLKILFCSSTEFACHHTAFDVSLSQEFHDSNNFGTWRTPMSWATVLYFKKSSSARIIFTLIHMIKNHWPHYRNLFGISNPVFRNDHALSMALLIAQCDRQSTQIPWNLCTILPQQQITQCDYDKWKISYIREQRPRHVFLQNQDFHVLNKSQLGDIIAKTQ